MIELTIKEVVSIIDNVEYPPRFTRSFIRQVESSGIVIVYGLSDDLLEFQGAIDDEIGACDGVEVLVSKNGVLPARDDIDTDEEMAQYLEDKANGQAVEAIWGNDVSWTIKTNIPHEKFHIMEDGEVYCLGVVFKMDDLK